MLGVSTPVVVAARNRGLPSDGGSGRRGGGSGSGGPAVAGPLLLLMMLMLLFLIPLVELISCSLVMNLCLSR